MIYSGLKTSLLSSHKRLLCLSLLLGGFGNLWAQPMAEPDYDVIVVPVGRAASPEGKNWAQSSLLEMGLSPQPVTDTSGKPMPLGEISASTDQIRIRLRSGEAVRLWSDSIPTSATQVFFTTTASLTGDKPQQSAIALVDADDPRHLGVSLSMGNDLVLDGKPYSFDFEREAGRFLLLLQFLGPSTGECVVTLQRLRLLAGYRTIDFSLGITRMSEMETFDEGIEKIVKMTPPSTLGAVFQSLPGLSRSTVSATTAKSLLLRTDNAEDVIQVAIPLVLQKTQSPDSSTVQIYGRAYLRRLEGEEGIFSIALFSGESASGGYRDFPVSALPKEGWLRVESPARFSSESANPLFLILQIREGRSTLAVDDVSLESFNSPPPFWDADLVKKHYPDYFK